MQKYCTHCGTELNSDSKFCTNCGTAIGGISSDIAEAVIADDDQILQPPHMPQRISRHALPVAFGLGVVVLAATYWFAFREAPVVKVAEPAAVVAPAAVAAATPQTESAPIPSTTQTPAVANNVLPVEVDWPQIYDVVKAKEANPNALTDISRQTVFRQIVTAAANAEIYKKITTLNPGNPPFFSVESLVTQGEEILLLNSHESHNASQHNALIAINLKKKSVTVCYREAGLSRWFIFGQMVHEDSGLDSCPWKLEGIPREVNQAPLPSYH